jgi:N-acetylglucosaminyl-diphospho-decaprenol L-rhamnosyltransferase
MNAKVDAVVVAYNSRDTLRGCVEPLAGMREVAVVVVDNASPDDGLATVADLPARLVPAGRNGGFSFGCNLGASFGSAPYVLFVNPDARVEPAALKALVRVLDEDPALALAAPRILREDGTLHYSQRQAPRLRSTWAQAFFLHRVFRRAGWADELVRDPAAYERPGSPDWLSGACMLVRRSAFEQVGGFDEGFFLYCEDTDLCVRLRAAGHGLRFEPSAVVQHVGGASAPRSATLVVAARSRVRYARKHYRPAAALLEAAGVAAGEATHAAVWLRRPALARGHVAAFGAALTPAPTR